MAQESRKKSHHRQPHGVPTRHRKPVEQLFEQLDATHPTAAPSEKARGRAPRRYRDPAGRTALAVFAGGLIVGLLATLVRKRL